MFAFGELLKGGSEHGNRCRVGGGPQIVRAQVLLAHGPVPGVPGAARLRPQLLSEGGRPPYPRPNPSLPPAVILHGAVFTLWMAVIVTQTQLIAARKHEVHMRLGKLAFLLAILMIPVMYLTAVWQV